MYNGEDNGGAQAEAGPQGYAGLWVWATPSASLGAQLLSGLDKRSPKNKKSSVLCLTPKERKHVRFKLL